MFYFWREVGRRMNIQHIPDDYDAFERFSRDYEAKHFRYTEANHRVGCATRDMFASWFPRLLRPLVRPAIYAIRCCTSGSAAKSLPRASAAKRCFR